MSNLRKYLISLFLSISLSATITVPTDYTTIQQAIDASVDGDVINVLSGTYYENINYNGKNIEIVGETRNDHYRWFSRFRITEFPNSGFEQGMQTWDMYPNWNSHQIAQTGDEIYNSEQLFEAFEVSILQKFEDYMRAIILKIIYISHSMIVNFHLVLK